MSLPWLSDPRRPLTSPREIPKLEAWFDALDTSSMLTGAGATITDGGSVALWADKSGNSGVNCLCSPGANTTANSATLGAIGALGTSNFTVVARVSVSSYASGTDLLLVGIGNGANAANLIAKNGTSRVQMSKATVGYVSATNGSNLSAFTTYTVTYTKSGTTGTYYINGIADGTCTDNFDYTANSGVVIGQFNTGVGSIVYQARVYSVALDAAGVLADYNGTVQANCVLNIDFALSGKKLANGDKFTCSTGQEVTLNSSGATGARIAGERDLFQGTAANRPVWLQYAGTKYAYFAGIAGFTVSVPLANDTYDVAITYKDATTDTSTVVVGAGVAAFGGTDAKFASKMVTRIVVSKSSVAQATFDPSLYTSGTSFTSSDGKTWTINGGAHIVTRTGLYFDGSNDYLKSAAFSLSQPETVYFMGSQISWTNGDVMFDGGGASNQAAIYQTGSSPNVAISSGVPLGTITTFAVQAFGMIASVFNGASSSVRHNRNAPATGNAGTQASNGLCIGSYTAGGSNANCFVSEPVVYASAHDIATQNRMALYAGRKWGFAS